MPSVSFALAELTGGEADSSVSVCVTLSDLPEDRQDCPLTLTLTAGPAEGYKSGIHIFYNVYFFSS